MNSSDSVVDLSEDDSDKVVTKVKCAHDVLGSCDNMVVAELLMNKIINLTIDDTIPHKMIEQKRRSHPKKISP